jgi:hypothetical protein
VDTDEVMKALKKAFGLDYFESSERTSALLVLGAAVLTILSIFLGRIGVALFFSLFWVAFVSGGARVLSPLIDDAWRKTMSGSGKEDSPPASSAEFSSESAGGEQEAGADSAASAESTGEEGDRKS